jgi:hypothetical protein
MGILDAPGVTKAQARSLVNAGGSGVTPPVFARANNGVPIFTQAAQNPASGALAPTASGSIYWPWIIDARKLLGVSALDEFYMYYSTDHEATHENSGVWLATAPTELGPWTGRGRVYIDNSVGAQTETPSVFADPVVSGGLIMLYQQQDVTGANGIQSSNYATSTDGVAWVRGGLAIDVPLNWPNSDGHTGYAIPQTIGGNLTAHHLAGGGNYPMFAMSTSTDGRTWTIDRRHLTWQMDLVGDGRRVEWNSGYVIRWNGQLWWIGLASNFTSGATPKDARIVVAPISDDLHNLTAPTQIVLYPTQSGESTNYRAIYAFIGRDGRLYLYYQCGGSFYVAIAGGLA